MNYTVAVERMAYGADAIGHLPNGKTVFIRNGVPGDTVEIELFKEKKSFAYSQITRIISASPFRIKPVSPVDQLAGTAPWQHLTYDAQLRAKRDIVVGALVHTARIEAAQAEKMVEACLPSRCEWNYRNKLELVCFTDQNSKLKLGFHHEGTNKPIPADSSKLAHKAIEKAPKALQGALRYVQSNQNLGIYRIGIRHSLATDELEVALWTQPSSFPRATTAKTLSSALKTTSIVRVLAEPGKARKIKGVETLYGRGYWRERIGGIEFSTQAPSFFQVNTAQASKIIDTVIERLGDINGRYVADLFAGGGTFSIPLALAGADVVAIEAAKSSVRDLRYNACNNGVDIEVVGGDATQMLPTLGKLDALVIDPPRAGLSAEIIKSIASASSQCIAYVSCDPLTLARDLVRFTTAGYHLQSVTPIDLFPQTFHVETVCLLSKIYSNER